MKVGFLRKVIAKSLPLIDMCVYDIREKVFNGHFIIERNFEVRSVESVSEEPALFERDTPRL